MTDKELKEILDKHKQWLLLDKDKKWVHNEEGYVQANFRCADLSGENLMGVDLREADCQFTDLHGSNLSLARLRGACFYKANLQKVNFTMADLSRTMLTKADLRGAVFCGADLRDANLSDANLTGADLSGACLSGANLQGTVLKNVRLNYLTENFFIACPEEGAFIAYKKASDKIVVLEISADAKRSSATTNKCRCNKAKVLRIEELDGSISSATSVASYFDKNFIYRVGETVEVENFDKDRWNDCSTGIHFFISRQCAVNYER